MNQPVYVLTVADTVGIAIVLVVAIIYWWNWPRGKDGDSDG